MQQNEAFDLLKIGKNTFLTGAAGAGKTYLLNKYINYLKDNNVNVAITASTGIAATHLQGTTIHSWSGIGVRETLTRKDLDKLLDTPRIKRNYKKAKVLIIDEISMLHKHQLDMVDMVAKHILDSDAPFGGIQIVLCGDFFQLPPISSSPLSGDKQFAFEAESWANGNFHVCYLSENHRQGEDPLIRVLNDIRGGVAGEQTKVPLRTRYKKEPEGATKATKLYSRNINVDAINEQELLQLPGDERVYHMSTEGFGALVDGLRKSCLAMEILRLKVGSEVMFIKNDAMGEYVNGTRAIVTGFDVSDGWPIVRTYDGKKIVAYPEEWKYEDNGITRATITQVPLRLAWAITVHKSQGMTLDAAEMDLGDAFEPGMGYVALSRVRKLSGLKLMNLNEMALKVHPRILRHDNIFKDNSSSALEYLKSLPLDKKEAMQRETMLVRFGGNIPKGEVARITSKEKSDKSKKEPAAATHVKTLEMLKEKLPIDIIAKERGLSTGTIIGHIEKLKGLKQVNNSLIEYLKNILPANDFELMLNEFQQSEDGKLTPIYEKFSGKYSYDDIKIVRLFV